MVDKDHTSRRAVLKTIAGAGATACGVGVIGSASAFQVKSTVKIIGEEGGCGFWGCHGGDSYDFWIRDQWSHDDYQTRKFERDDSIGIPAGDGNAIRVTGKVYGGEDIVDLNREIDPGLLSPGWGGVPEGVTIKVDGEKAYL